VRPTSHPAWPGPQVNYGFGVNTHNKLKELGADAELNTYRGMGHSAVPSELAAVSAFLKQVLPPQ
jgi:predicted esterase